jgi:predicted nucleotidyltransferase
MKVVGLITEYNPFHNGHKYHIEEAKKRTGADYVVAVMSGNFVQRGAPAAIDKYSRTAMALANGVDLVIELPVCYATGSAEFFAHGAVSILDKLGIVDFLCFGSECGDIGLLKKAAEQFVSMPDSFESELKRFLKDGLTYPAARLKALSNMLQDNSLQEKNADAQLLSQILAEPNNILGIEYLKALHTFSSPIEPLTIQRISAHYHATELSKQGAPDSEDKLTGPVPLISSATAIRKSICHTSDCSLPSFADIEHSVPENVSEFLKRNYQKSYPISEEDFAQIIKYKLLLEDSDTLSTYQDITKDLAERMKKHSDLNMNIASLLQLIKTKNMTLTRINRALVHVLLNIKTASIKEYIASGYTPYARILGIKKESSSLLRIIKKHGRIPVITKVSAAKDLLDETGLKMLSEDIFASHVYNQAVYEKYGTVLTNEYKHGICIMS